jgi:hypothetical protein
MDGGTPSSGLPQRSGIEARVHDVITGHAAAWGKPIQQKVPITLTICHLGGQRPWFVCPVHCDGPRVRAGLVRQGERVALGCAANEQRLQLQRSVI